MKKVKQSFLYSLLATGIIQTAACNNSPGDQPSTDTGTISNTDSMPVIKPMITDSGSVVRPPETNDKNVIKLDTNGHTR